MGAEEVTLLLSRGSYVILKWTGSRYEQDTNVTVNDTKDMFREVSFASDRQMRWVNEMKILRAPRPGQPKVWLQHGVDVTFTIAKII